MLEELGIECRCVHAFLYLFCFAKLCLFSPPEYGLWCCGPWQVHNYVQQLRPMTYVQEHDLDFIVACLESVLYPVPWITLPTIHADGDSFATQAFAKFNFRPSLGVFGGSSWEGGHGRLAATHGVESVR